ncbi:MAG: hypothetical protein U5J63_06190 [Fodinibius sp.]|nr:hypothetical protein [Fodinibius sp.]
MVKIKSKIFISSMKKLLTVTILAAFLSLSFSNFAQAQDSNKDLGIGFMVGEPTGLSLKSWTGGGNAFDLGLAWSLVAMSYLTSMPIICGTTTRFLEQLIRLATTVLWYWGSSRF